MNLQENIRKILREGTNSKSTWVESNGKLTKKYKFSDYDETIDFVNKVARIAKKQNHHPDMKVGYDTIELSIFDHEEKKISDKCYKFANAVEKIK
jgi:4a-hydroxytetrahydrobiopterin dehydratase